MSCTHDCGCSAETRDARTDDWGHTSPLSPQNADLREFQPAEPSQPLGDVPASERPREAVLPRPITPEDVRVGMLVERRNGECYVGGRVESIDGSGIWLHDRAGATGGVPTAWIFGAKYAERGWSLWLIEDAPAPVDPDAAAVEAIVTAYRRSPECSTHAVFGEAMLDHLRDQGFDVTPRAEQ